ncbi:DUF1857-domain-containing protein [Pholiota conissans]|uniref:DUF1857-domain-containing protein n=1 Tax=Pholiota conissans TaxID=109636 RepID=A0A9P5Z244_9AGAR|nr:DUF1857-domain-containing protein [Pholiota conissans]
MSKLNFAVSRLVNPQGASPVLTEAQVWHGLQLKVRSPGEFVPVITSCEILSDEGDKVSRLVGFRDGVTAREEVEEYQGAIAYFDSQTMGTRITNVLSYNEDNEMVLTFSFAGGVPGYNVSSASESSSRPSVKEMNETVGPAVEGTIRRIRELVRDGRIV